MATRHPHEFSMTVEMSQFSGQKEARINPENHDGLEVYMRLGDTNKPTLTIDSLTIEKILMVLLRLQS